MTCFEDDMLIMFMNYDLFSIIFLVFLINELRIFWKYIFFPKCKFRPIFSFFGGKLKFFVQNFEKETLELVKIQFYLFFQVALASYPKWANGNQGEKHVALSTISTFGIKRHLAYLPSPLESPSDTPF